MIEIPISINVHGLDTDTYLIGGILIANVGRCSKISDEYRYLYMLHDKSWGIVTHDRRSDVYSLLRSVLNNTQQCSNPSEYELRVISDFYRRIDDLHCSN